MSGARALTVAALALASTVAASAAAPAITGCDATTWFAVANGTAGCPPLDPDTFSVSLDARGLDAVAVERLRRASAAIRLRVRPSGEGLDAVDLEPADLLVQSDNLTVELPASRLDDLAVAALAVVLPPGSLVCGGAVVEHQVAVPVPLGGSVTASCSRPAGDAGSRPLAWRFALAPAPADAAADPGVAVDFALEKTWGRDLRVHSRRRAWSSHLVELDLEGTGATGGVAFHDSLKAEVAVAWSRSTLGDDARRAAFPALWAGAYLRAESTIDGDVRALVVGARVEGVLNLRRLLGTDVAPGQRPYLALAYERVEPERRGGLQGGGHERLQGRFQWKLYPTDALVVEVDWEAHYLLGPGNVDRLHDRLDLTVAVAASPGAEFLPFLRYTRGADAPSFDIAEEVLFGLMWDRLFRRQRGGGR